MAEDDYNHNDKKKEQDRYSLEPEKAHCTGEFVIVAKFTGHVSHHLAYRRLWSGRKPERQTENLVLAILKKICT